MNKLIKAGIIGAVIFSSMEIGFILGRGHLLGVMVRRDITADQAIEILSESKNLEPQLVRIIAKHYEKKS